jgi:hypothetical protein
MAKGRNGQRMPLVVVRCSFALVLCPRRSCVARVMSLW